MAKTLLALRALMTRKLDLVDLADAVSKSRARRRLADVFNLWHTYTVAMRGDLDPDSPFLSPRTKKEDRQLIRNVATFVGSPEVGAEGRLWLMLGKHTVPARSISTRPVHFRDAWLLLLLLYASSQAVAMSEGSSGASSEDLERAHEVMTRREAYLRIASPERRQTGYSGISSTVGNVSLRSGFTSSPRTTAGGEGPSLGMPPRSAAYGPGVAGMREAEWREVRDDQLGYDALYRNTSTPEAATSFQARMMPQAGLTPPMFRGFGSGSQAAQQLVQPRPSAVPSSSAYVTPAAAGSRGSSQLYTPSGAGSQSGAVLLTNGWPAATPVPTSQGAPGVGGPQNPSAASGSRQSILSKAVQLQAAAASRRGSSFLLNAQAGRGQQGSLE